MSDRFILPEGNYAARVHAHALTADKNSGNERYTVEFVVSTGECVGEFARARYGFTSDAQTELSISQLRALGWRGNDFSNVELDTDKEFSIRVKHSFGKGEDGQEKTYVDALVNTGGVEKFALPPDRAKAFAAKMKARVAAFDAANGGPPKTAARAAAPATSVQRPAQGAPAPRANAAPVGSRRNPATSDDLVDPGGGFGDDDLPF